MQNSHAWLWEKIEAELLEANEVLDRLVADVGVEVERGRVDPQSAARSDRRRAVRVHVRQG